MRTMKAFRLRSARLAAIIPFAALLCGPPSATAASLLGSAQTFAVLGAQSVTNIGATTITGDIGVYPGTSYTGGGTVTQINGTVHINDGVAMQAQADALTAYNTLAAMPITNTLAPELGGVTLNPGVYNFSGGAALLSAGDTLTLNFTGPDQSFVFQIASSLTANVGSSVLVTGGGPTDSIYWQVGSSATLNGNTFDGNVIALASDTFGAGVNMCGRAIALNAAVTMISDTIANNCPATDFGSYGFSGGPVGGVPEPATWAMLILGVAMIGFAARRRREGMAVAA